uniref:L1 transposable element RRM domain-containing protein n=1 Tax=Pundamilia nyererei TaxID=303518 RepID=A0A3B4FQ70_9CICH
MSRKVNKSASTSQPNLRPAANTASPPRGKTLPLPGSPDTPLVDTEKFTKAELLSELREEISALFKKELMAAFAENLTSIRSDIQQLKTDLSSDITTMRQEFAGLRSTVMEVEQSLSTCTDDIVHLQAKVDAMSKELATLENKCEDLESRSRRNNIRIVGVPEENVLSATDVSMLLTEAFQLGKEPLVDRAHRTLAPKPNTGERPRAMLVKLHYYADCARILQKARELQRVQINNMTISVFPDHTAKTARARVAFNEVRRQLRGIQGVRFGILYPARLRITYQGMQRDFVSPDEDLARHSFPTLIQKKLSHLMLRKLSIVGRLI